MRSVARFLLLAILFLPAASHAQKKPNILLIVADDLGWGDVEFNGRRDWKTHNLDRLARQGTNLRRCYAGSVTCCPSRAVLMTGKYSIHCGVTANNDDLPSEEVTIAEALKPLGYVTGLFGKWHHGKPRSGHTTYVHPMDQGFDEFFGFTDAGLAHQKYPKQLWFGREERPVTGYSEHLFTEHGLDFLSRHKDRPFLLCMTYTNPHFNIAAPPEEVLPFRGRFQEKDPSKPANATYAAMVTDLDAQVGRLLKRLDELRLTENTLVFFTSDQGATFEVGNEGASNYHDSNRPFRGQKRTLWEGGTRVPGVVRWPGHVPAGRTSDEIIHFIDILPTCLAAAGGAADPSWHVDGINMLPVWLGHARAPERTLFWEWRSEGDYQVAAMRGDLKLVITDRNKPEIFNLARDEAERRNCIAEHQPLARQLRQELTDWLATETAAAREGKTR